MHQNNAAMKNQNLPADIFFEAVHNDTDQATKRRPVLIVCGDEECGDTVAQFVRKRGIEPVCCLSVNDARSLLLNQGFSAVFCSDILPDGDFQSVILSSGSTPVVVFSHLAEWDRYLEAVHRGAFDYTSCPPNFLEMERILQNATAEPSLDRPSR